ncbi:MAG: hypothetical protein EBT61_14545, partial [Verrucomicrobia bacterium]|nr:hypothetical protein [Verrucomicrobiota bacterium]
NTKCVALAVSPFCPRLPQQHGKFGFFLRPDRFRSHGLHPALVAGEYLAHYGWEVFLQMRHAGLQVFSMKPAWLPGNFFRCGASHV